MTVARAIPVLLLAVLASCANKHTPGSQVPRDAMYLGEHKGNWAFQAFEDGTLFIFDSDAGKTAYSGAVQHGDWVFFQPHWNKILYNKKTVVKEGGLDASHTYQFYFLKGTKPR